MRATSGTEPDATFPSGYQKGTFLSVGQMQEKKPMEDVCLRLVIGMLYSLFYHFPGSYSIRKVFEVYNTNLHSYDTYSFM